MTGVALVLLSGLVFLLASGSSVLAEEQLPDPVSDADYLTLDMEQVAFGRLLFWDPILSGNRNISCATCHHPRFGTADGVSLGLGEGGIGLGPDRRVDPLNTPEQRIPRNSPALFNLGAREFTVLFHDGRIETDPNRPSGLRTPLEEEMVTGFSGILSAQTMFPVLSQDEMAGHYSENDVAKAVRTGRITGPGGAWDVITRRVAANPAYAEMFEKAFPEAEEMDFTHISDAIAAFISFEWRSDDSPFDAHIRGETPLTGAARDGMDLFYGTAGCASCHSGPFQTDHGFHAMGVPQIGPGKAARFERHANDLGRLRVTGRTEDAFAFRTPSLRNVAATGPYGHSGAYADLRAFVESHIDPVTALMRYDPDQAVLPPLPGSQDWRVVEDPVARAAIADAVKRPPVSLSPDEIDALLAFLGALTDERALGGRLGIPDSVPSGLSIDR